MCECENYNLVSNVYHSLNKRNKNDDAKTNISLNLGMVGNVIGELGKITMERNIKNWEDK